MYVLPTSLYCIVPVRKTDPTKLQATLAPTSIMWTPVTVVVIVVVFVFILFRPFQSVLIVRIALCLANLTFLPLVCICRGTLPVTIAGKTAQIPIYSVCYFTLKWGESANSNFITFFENKRESCSSYKFTKIHLLMPMLTDQQVVKVVQALYDLCILGNAPEVTAIC